MHKLVRQQGDTIIEVMVAFAVFAMVAVGALTIMNQGTASAEDSLETTQVRQQIDTQAEMLRFMHQSYTSNPNDPDAAGLSNRFKGIIDQAKAMQLAGIEKATPFGQACTQSLPGPSDGRFILNPETGARLTATTDILPAQSINAGAMSPFAQFSGGRSYGLWIEPIISNVSVSGEAQYIDFHIKACWDGAAGAQQRTLGTIVRLYVPENIDTGTTGGGSTPIAQPILHRFDMVGSSATQCNPHADVERDESEGDPSWNPNNSAFYLNPPVSIWNCQINGNELFACVNYDAWYKPSAMTTASDGTSYKLTITYDDALSCSATPTLTLPYQFRVAVYVDGVKRGPDYNLPPGGGPFVIDDIGAFTTSSTLQIRWWNNHDVSGQDPDFVIKQIQLERVE